jgi:hypothetical protein
VYLCVLTSAASLIPREVLIGYIDRRILAAHAFGVQMNFGFMASIVIAIVAVLGVFVEIPIVSDYAFSVMAGAHLVLLGFTGGLRRKNETNEDRMRRPSKFARAKAERTHPLPGFFSIRREHLISSRMLVRVTGFTRATRLMP